MDCRDYLEDRIMDLTNWDNYRDRFELRFPEEEKQLEIYYNSERILSIVKS